MFFVKVLSLLHVTELQGFMGPFTPNGHFKHTIFMTTKLQDKWKHFRKILGFFPWSLIDMNWGSKKGFLLYSSAYYKALEKWSWDGVFQIAKAHTCSLITSKDPSEWKKEWKKKTKKQVSGFFNQFTNTLGQLHKYLLDTFHKTGHTSICGQWVPLCPQRHHSFCVMRLFWLQRSNLKLKALQWEKFEYELRIRLLYQY